MKSTSFLDAAPTIADAIHVDGRFESVATPRTFGAEAAVVADEPKGPVGVAERLVIIASQQVVVFLRMPIRVGRVIFQEIPTHFL